MPALDILRFVVFGLFVYASATAVSNWALRTQRINPFSGTGRLVRRLTDPAIMPIERWLLRRGGNPQNAGWWLMGVAVVGGILVITVAEWVIVQVVQVAGAASRGPAGVIRMLVYYAGQLLSIALIVRVVGSWFGAGRFSPWTGWSYKLTDWIVEPLRKIIPPIGGVIDISPLVAWFLIQFLVLPVIMSVL